MLHCMILIIILWLWKRMVQLCTKGWTEWALCLNWLPTGSEIYVLECMCTRAYVRTCVRVLRETHVVGKMPIIDESGYTVLCTLSCNSSLSFYLFQTKVTKTIAMGADFQVLKSFGPSSDWLWRPMTLWTHWIWLSQLCHHSLVTVSHTGTVDPWSQGHFTWEFTSLLPYRPSSGGYKGDKTYPQP